MNLVLQFKNARLQFWDCAVPSTRQPRALMGQQAAPLNKRVNNFVFVRTYLIFVSRLLGRTRDRNSAQK